MTIPVDRYRVQGHTIGSGVSLAAVEGKTAEIKFDSSAGQSESLPGPADLLVTAFAACVLKNVERMAGLQPFSFTRATIDVTAVRQARPPKMTQISYILTVETTEPEHRVDLLHRNIAKQGTIYNTLAAACEVSGVIVAIAPEQTG